MTKYTKQQRLKSKTKILVSISLLVLFVGLEKGRLVFVHCEIGIRMSLTIVFKMHETVENLHLYNYVL